MNSDVTLFKQRTRQLLREERVAAAARDNKLDDGFGHGGRIDRVRDDVRHTAG